MSGSALANWAINRDEKDNHLSRMFALASDVGEYASTYDELIPVLHSLPAEVLLKHTHHNLLIKKRNGERSAKLFWTPVIESITLIIKTFSNKRIIKWFILQPKTPLIHSLHVIH